MPTTSTYLLPVITWVLGVVSSILVVWYTSRSTLQRDHEMKALERREARLLRRNEFQRESLLALQDAAATLLAVTIETYRTEFATPSGEGVKPSIDNDREYMNADARMGMLLHRVTDEEVRKQCNEFRVRCITSTGPKKDRDEARDAVSGCSKQLSHLNKAIGKVLAKLDALDDQIGS